MHLAAPETSDPAVVPPVQAADWAQLSQLRVVFGHQSVGNNIVNGIERLAARDGINIGIHERRATPALLGINHFLIGQNGDPTSKIRDFATALNAGTPGWADVALMKLCYADFESTTDPQRVANDYISSLDSLAQGHPSTRFIAVTSPLVAVRPGPKTWIKQLIGSLNGGYSPNAKRAEFNALVRQRYFGSGHLFDLARVEANAYDTHDDCCLPVVERQAGEEPAEAPVESLRAELTDDGGHLNERGQLLAARALLRVISSVAGKRTAG